MSCEITQEWYNSLKRRRMVTGSPLDLNNPIAAFQMWDVIVGVDKGIFTLPEGFKW